MLSVHRHLSRVAASRLFDVMHETYMLTSRVVVGGNGGGGGDSESGHAGFRQAVCFTVE